MTRFARAKGSKSSNERTPEDSTPWEVMKEQLLKAKKDGDESKKRQEAEQQRIDNYENFLKERKVQKRQATWCDFPESEIIKGKASEENGPVKKNKKTKAKIQKNSNGHDNRVNEIPESPKEEINTKKKKNKLTGSEPEKYELAKKKKRKNKHINTVQDSPIINEQVEHENSENFGDNVTMNKNNISKSVVNIDQSENLSNETGGRQKNKKKKNAKNQATKVNQNQPKTDKKDSTQSLEDGTATNDIESCKAAKQNGPKNKKKKLLNGKPTRRKEINDLSFQLIINSKEVELVRFDGFPIMKKDADRLEELKSSMIKKGIPKSEVQRTIKLERRRAEKALARLKRDVCYNCRKGGHVLSDCPELKSKIPGADADGVCFKCGSTEHRQFECKVQRDKEFRFATCFICKEPGHIARQCPDNPKGLYPNGGSCKLCGDVTHLRKDCPTVSDKKEESNIKLQTLDASEDIEDVGQQAKPVVQETSKKPKKIKF